MFKLKGRRRSYGAMALFAGSMAVPAIVVAAEPIMAFDIPAGSLDSALKRFEQITHLQVLYQTSTVAGRSAPRLAGRYAPDQALTLLLRGSDMTVERAGPSTLVVKRRAATTAVSPSGSNDGPISTRVREDGLLGSSAGGASERVDDPSLSTPAPVDVVVTGTHIRGAKGGPSPLVQINRDDLRRDGDATIADALTRLPQNFSGQNEPNSTLVGSDRTGANGIFSQSVNLRGLGSNATLVLVDGRRLAGSGIMGNFTDVSAIPTAAVDHVDILLDGASAIYGSDAVGGVVNIVTRRNFEGAESVARYGELSGGHAPSLQLSQTYGKTWDGGHVVVALSYQHRGNLPASARSYAANSDLTALGGSNFSTVYGSPGNIVAYNAAKGAYVSLYAIPGGTGLGLTPSSFIAGATNYQNLRSGVDLFPNQDTDSLYLSAAQTLDAKTEVNFEGRFNLRSFRARTYASQTILTVTNKNPYFVSPNGTTSESIGYSADGALGPIRNDGESRSFDLSVGLDRDLSRTWTLHSYVGFAGEEAHRLAANQLNTSNLSEALGTTADNPATAFSNAVNGFFNPYGSGASNARAVLDFIGSGTSLQKDDDHNLTIDVEADGELVALAAGPIKAAFGAQYRHERSEYTSRGYTTATPSLLGGVGYGRDVSALFGELNIPVVGQTNALPAVRRLNLTVAGRFEHYDDVGSTANPKIGLVWVPVDDITVRANYGTSFRAPAEYEMHTPFVIQGSSIPSSTGTTLSLIEYGGNTGLKPETATSWTSGVDWAPHQVKGLRLSASWFDIDYRDRIGNPGSTALATVLIDPSYAALVTRLNGADAADLAKVQAIQALSPSSSAAALPASAFGAIVDARYLNVSSLEVSGVDFEAHYGFALAGDRLALTGAASYVYNYRQQTTPTSPTTQYVSTVGLPVDWRGRGTLVWSHGPFDTALSVNFVNSYNDPTNRRTIGSWTTADLSLSWTSPVREGAAQGLVVTASAQNLFDTDPPFYNAYYGVGYDAANATPLGRAVAVQITKRW
jgi:outer membrane receptor protein involved in Fe transport